MRNYKTLIQVSIVSNLISVCSGIGLLFAGIYYTREVLDGNPVASALSIAGVSLVLFLFSAPAAISTTLLASGLVMSKKTENAVTKDSWLKMDLRLAQLMGFVTALLCVAVAVEFVWILVQVVQDFRWSAN